MAEAHLIVFDLDGTLVDTAGDLVSALNHVMAQEGLPQVPVESARKMIGGGARKLIERGLEAEGRVLTQDQISTLTKHFIAYYADHIAEQSRPFDGLIAALDQLSARGFRFAVCTNKLEWLSKRLLDELKMTARFDAICGADTFGVAKPDPAILKQTIAQAGGTLSRAIMVGDSGPDVGAARRAGVPVIGVTFGYTDTPIEELKPDLIISHMDQLVGAIDQVLSRA